MHPAQASSSRPPLPVPGDLSPERFHTLEQLVEEGTDHIVEQWLRHVDADRRVPSTAKISESMLRDSVPGVLHEILRALTPAGEPGSRARRSFKAKAHGEARARQGFAIDELVREYQVLRTELFRYLETRLAEFEDITVGQAMGLCRQVGQALDDALRVTTQAYLESHTRELRLLSQSDSLTGLLNHRVFYERLAAEIERSERYGLELTLLLLDLDRFKQVNEECGHLAGDQLLRHTGEVLEVSVRRSDLVSRYGGDEFAVIFPETGLDAAAALLPRIAHRLETVGRSMDLPLPLRFSHGLAAFAEDGRDAEALVESADQRLRRVKRDKARTEGDLR